MTGRLQTALSHLLIPIVAFTATMLPAKAETDFGDVAMRVAHMLRNRHYSRHDFDDAMSKRLLDNYLEYLDFNRVYLTQEDIDEFQSAYATKLDDSIYNLDIEPGHIMHERRLKRVEDRVAKIKDELENGTFDFSSDREVVQSRKEEPWPKDLAEADQIWHDILEAELLQEQLRIEGIEARKAEKGAEPFKEGEQAKTEEEENPRERILKRYERYLESLKQDDDEDVANLFLTALATAYDPHSEYFSQSELESFQTNMKKSLKGIGALLSMRDGKEAEIQGIVVGGPADKAGTLQVGDRIVGVGQGKTKELIDITYMKLQKVVDLIRGPEGSTVRLKIIPADADDDSLTKLIEIVRDEVQLKDKLATAELIQMKGQTGEDRKIGWIYLPSFYADMEGGSTSMTADVKRLLGRLMKEKIDSLIIDVRGNGGGSLEEAIKMTGLFITKGPVVQSKDYKDKIEPRFSRQRKPFYDGPLVVLTDRISASASEILAAALQDYNRALIVGGSTFGKGSVQTIYPVAKELPFFANKDRSGALKVTIQKFYRISGGSTQEKGVVPDVHLPSIYDALERGEGSLKYPLKWDEIGKLGYNKTSNTAFPVKELSSRSEKRMSQDIDFNYLREDMDRLKKQVDKNTISLNIEKRRQETKKTRNRTKERNDEKRIRYAAMEGEQSEAFKIYKLTLDNVDEEGLTLAADFTDEENTGFRLGKDDEDDENDTPDYPFDLDPMKREALHVMDDFLDLLSPKKTASVGLGKEETSAKN